MRLKNQICRALEAALALHEDFEVLADGMAVSVDDATDFEPDVTVHSGQKIPTGTIAVPNPVIVVEVISPSSQRIGSTVKREKYLNVPSIAHYLTFRTDRREVMHWKRGAVSPQTVRTGALPLDPPGIGLDLDLIYARAGIPG